MSVFTVDTAGLFAQPYVDYLNLNVQDYGEQKLEEKKEEIIEREAIKKVGSAKESSSLTYILFGVGAVLVLTLAVLKKKGVI